MGCTLEHEQALMKQGAGRIAGIDEAGRGCLAGPVVAAAVVLPVGFTHPVLNDSKKLTAARRERIYEELTADKSIAWAVAAVDAQRIDEVNILKASHEAMRLAVESLEPAPDHALIDGLPVEPFPVAATALVKGDGISLSIAAASVLAKVTRDRMMVRFDAEYPGYGFSGHKGYGTERHLEALHRHGPCHIHRKTFGPVSQLRFRI